MDLIAPGAAEDRVAVAAGAQHLTYGELRRLVRAAIAYFRQAGVGPSSRIAIGAGSNRDGQSLDNWIAHLAIMAIGATHASVGSGQGLARLIQARLVKILIGPARPGEPVPKPLRLIPFRAALLAPVRGDDPITLHPRAVRLNMSSGTTGTPKRVEWDSAMIEQRLAQAGEFVTGDTKLFDFLSMTTTAGFRYPLATWRAGGTVLFYPQGDEKGLRRTIERSNLFVCSPDELSHRLKKNDGPWLGREDRTIMVLGARLPTAVRDAALKDVGREIVISYGSTEGGSVASGSSDLLDRHPGAVGFVRERVTVRVADDRGVECPPGVAGELAIQGPAVCRAAYRGSGKGDRWFYPGDLAVLHEDGLLAIEGRVSETLNLGGTKHNAAAMETRLLKIEGIDDAAVCVVSTKSSDHGVVALVCEASVDVEAIRPAITEAVTLRDFEIIRIEKLPRNSMGKIVRHDLGRQLKPAIEALGARQDA